MANSVYAINKGINAPITFKGLKAQYIWYLGGGVIGLFIGFAILYITGLNPFVCLGIVAAGGAGLFVYVYRLSNTHGEYGLMKKAAKRGVPKVVTCRSRKVFF
jgi:hypothetical protein